MTITELRDIGAPRRADTGDAPTGAFAARSDADLASASARGAHGAFDELVRRYERRVHALLRQRCPTPEDAEDATQETFLSAWRSVSRYDPRRPFASWLFAIAVRRAASCERRRRRRIARAPGGETVERAAPALEGEPDGSVWRVARACLGSRANTLLWLVYAEGLTAAAAAEVVGSSPVLVRVTLHRARKRLERELNGAES